MTCSGQLILRWEYIWGIAIPGFLPPSSKSWTHPCHELLAFLCHWVGPQHDANLHMWNQLTCIHCVPAHSGASELCKVNKQNVCGEDCSGRGSSPSGHLACSLSLAQRHFGSETLLWRSSLYPKNISSQSVSQKGLQQLKRVLCSLGLPQVTVSMSISK